MELHTRKLYWTMTRYGANMPFQLIPDLLTHHPVPPRRCAAARFSIAAGLKQDGRHHAASRCRIVLKDCSATMLPTQVGAPQRQGFDSASSSP